MKPEHQIRINFTLGSQKICSVTDFPVQKNQCLDSGQIILLCKPVISVDRLHE